MRPFIPPGLSTGQLVRKLAKRWIDNDVSARAATLSYYFLFSLFPLLFFLVTLTAYLPLQGARDELLDRLGELMPDQAFGIIENHLHDLLDHPRPKLLTLGLLVAFWSASRGVDALRAALNLSYDVKESRPFWRTQLSALALTVLGSLLVLAAVAMIALGGSAGLWLANHLGVGWEYQLIWSWLRWPITACVIMLAGALLYYFLPDVKQEFRFITPGSVLGTLLWLLGTWGFTLYAEHFGSYNATYGSIGGVIVLMTWLFISGLVFILGGELNALLEHASSEGKAAGARAAGEPAPPLAERPSIASPGAVNAAGAAERSAARTARAVEQSEGDPTLH